MAAVRRSSRLSPWSEIFRGGSLIPLDTLSYVWHSVDMRNRLLVKLERDGRRVIINLRADDYQQSVRNGRMKWGSGRMWTVVEATELAQ